MVLKPKSKKFVFHTLLPGSTQAWKIPHFLYFFGTPPLVARPALVMWSSFSLCLIGSAVLSVWGGQSSLVLYLGTATLGVGMASIFATGFLWTEQKISVTSKVVVRVVAGVCIVTLQVSAAFIISSSLGAKVFPVLVGNLVETSPMVLHYLCLAIVCGCVLIFSLATLVISRCSVLTAQCKSMW